MNTRTMHTTAEAARGVPTSILALLLSGGLLGGLALVMVLGPGCVSTPGPNGATRDAVEAAARGAPIMVTVASPLWNSIAEAALGLISAGLATWNVQQHRRLAALEAANSAGHKEAKGAGRKG